MIGFQKLREILGEDEFVKNQANLMLFNIGDLERELTSDVASDLIKSISDKIDIEKINLKWSLPKSMTNNATGKKSQSIVKYYPYGELFGLGSRNGKLLIRNIRTSFVNSPAKFGNEQQKSMVETITPV